MPQRLQRPDGHPRHLNFQLLCQIQRTIFCHPFFLTNPPYLKSMVPSCSPKIPLTLHSCAICALVFSPDATIYPNISSNQLKNNHSSVSLALQKTEALKGLVPPALDQYLPLKAKEHIFNREGATGTSNATTVAGCFKNIGDTPMVDLLGRPILC